MMATNFPSSLDSLTNPTASDKLNSVTVPHATQHANVNDAVEALEAKVGVDGSAVTSSHDYILTNGVLPTLNVDSGVLVVDDTNNRVGVNDATPSYALDVTGDINTTGSLRFGGTATAEPVAFTPVIKQGATTFTVTTTEASYYQINKLVYGTVYVTIASGTGQVGNLLLVDLPVNATSAPGSVVGSVWIYDSSVVTGYGGQTVLLTTAALSFVGDWSGGNAFGISPAVQLTTSDQVRFNVCYEVA